MNKYIYSLIWLLFIAGVVWLIVTPGKHGKFVPYDEKTSREVALICTTDMATKFHIHPVLKIIIAGVEQKIPANIGITGLCMNSIHTHDDSGTLHIESPVQKDFMLGDFFAVWGKEFSQNQILDYKIDNTHAIVVTVNSKSVDTYENTVMKDKDDIVIEYKEAKK